MAHLFSAAGSRACRGRSISMVAVIVALALLLVLQPGAAQAQAARVTDEEIEASIERGVAALLADQRDNGWWSETGLYTPFSSHTYAGGLEVCAMLALAYAGVPMSNEKMAKGFDALMKFEMLQTYNSSFRVLVIAKMFDRLDRQRQTVARAVAQRDIRFIESLQHDNGGWGYPVYEKDSNPPRRVARDTWWDFSNTQMAILALSEAVKLRIEVNPVVWRKAMELFIQQQLPDGGWNYGHRFSGNNGRNQSYGSMTAAAVASLMLIRDNLFPGLGCPCVNDSSRNRIAAIDTALEKGFGWLGKHFSASQHPAAAGNDTDGIARWIPYWLYSCERVGLAGGIKYFGGHDWYAQGAAWFLRRQDRRTNMWRTIDDTSYAICFLVKGRAPILFNKLQFDGLWNNHPQDLPNLVHYIGQQKEQLMQWQVMNLEVPVEEWHDAPILFISAESDMNLTDENKAKLREYTDTGGTIFFEASCGNRATQAYWRRILAEVWPEYELQRLPAEHPLFSSDRQMTRRPPNLMGLNDGVRTFMFVTFTDISCIWAMRVVGPQQAMFDLGMNMYVYAADRRPLRARLASVLPEARYAEATIAAGPRSNIRIARVKHGGDWAIASHYKPLERLAERVTAQGQLRLEVAEPAAPAELGEDVQVAYLTGRRGLMLMENDTRALKAFVERGGMLLVDACLGSAEFDADFRKAAEALGLTIRAIRREHALVTGKMEGATGYDVSTVGFKFNLRRERLARPEPELHLLTLGDRVVGVYSPFDLLYAQTGFDAFDNRGYATDDARAILTNILLLISATPAAQQP
jgi:hypothetical protein